MTNYPRIAVRAIISNDFGAVLILQRTNTKYSAGFWELPGGKVEYGETVVNALEHEIQEETSLKITETKYFTYLDGIPGNEKLPHFITLIFTCKSSGKVCLSMDSSDFRWINKNELSSFILAFKNENALKMFWEI